MSEETKLSVRERIVKISNEIRVSKSGRNEFTKSGYFQPDDILKAVNPLLEKYQLIAEFDMKYIKEIEMYRGELLIADFNTDDGQRIFTFDIPMQELRSVGKAQMAGATQTYCKRYLYMNAFNLADNKADPDSKTNKPAEDYEHLLRDCKTAKELQAIWAKLPAKEKGRLFTLKEELKNAYASK